MNPDGPVVVIGDLITDTIVSALSTRHDNADTPSVIVRSPGGQGANQAAWLAWAGARTALIARVGAADAELHRAQLLRRGITPHLTADPDRPTGEIVVIVDHGTGARHMYTQRGAADHLHADDIDESVIASSAWVHVSGYVLAGLHGPQVMQRIAELTSLYEVPWSLDPASVTHIGRLGPAVFTLPGLSVIFPNEDELAALTGTHHEEEAIRALNVSARIVVAKLGPRGATAATAATADGDHVHLDAEPVEVVDTTGAGDALAAGFLAAHVRGASLAVALAEGVHLASLAVSKLGAQPG